MMNAQKNMPGLSPRVRGNQGAVGESQPGRRSIPACAGEPLYLIPCVCISTVYPRVCGGTPEKVDSSLVTEGLSPACAGEPRPVPMFAPLASVYPRVCGGTNQYFYSVADGAGLSPRVRGNHSNFLPRSSPARSIPACAGEPNAPTSDKSR